MREYAMSTVHFRVDRTRSHNTRHRIFAILAGVLLAIPATLGPAAAASASDWGGYADPASCSGNDLVKEVNVYSNSGVYVGLLQIKYSNGCPGNYARFQSAVGSAQTVALSIHSQVGWQNSAGADETNASVVWTRVIQLNDPSDTVCAYLDLTYYGYGTASGWTCA